MKSDDAFHAFAVFASGYAKRWLDQQYDKLEGTELGRKARAIDPKFKYTIEAGLYAVMAYLEQKILSDTPLKKFLKEVVKDVPPEFAKRMINGVRNEMEEDLKSLSEPGAADAMRSLLQLDDAQLQVVLTWLATKPEQRDQLLQRLARFSPDELRRLAAMPADLRDALFISPPKKTSEPSELANLMGAAEAKMKSARAALQKKTDAIHSRSKT